MTFSLVVHDPDSGAFGAVICSSSPAVAARCLHLRAGIGVVSSQNVTNPALGEAALKALARGHRAAEALAYALHTDSYPSYRQVLVVDGRCSPAAYSGDQSLGVHAEVVGAHEAAAGNLLADQGVIEAMHDGYLSSRAASLERRLLDGLQAAIRAGGELGPVHSAGLVVVEDVAWPVTDLRVDWHDEPAAQLCELWDLWQSQKQDYRVRAVDPTRAPSYGVAGDL